MACEVIDCPHCRVKKLMRSLAAADVSDESGYLMFVCGHCRKPVMLLVKAERPKFEYQRLNEVKRADLSLATCGWRVHGSWPKPDFRTGLCPNGVPENISALFEHSLEAGAKRAYGLSILGLRRVLDITRATTSPEFKGTAQAWILSLIRSGRLTANMKSFADRMNFQSEIVGATALEGAEYVTLVQILLEQIFGVRSRIELFRERA